MNRIAVIVIGSNSTRMLAADACYALSNEERGRTETRLFLGMTEDNMLSRDAVEYTAQSVLQLKAQAEASGAQLIAICATSATRDAKNRHELAQLIEASTGFPLHIISGEEEAAFSFAGAAGTNKACVFDIGGGSTEIVLGQNMHPDFKCSLQLGASRLFKHCPINCAADIKAAYDCARSLIHELPDRVRRHESFDSFYLVGGTGTSSARMLRQTPEGCRVTRTQVHDLLTLIADTPREKRTDIPGFPAQRVDILPTGLAILLSLMDEFCLSSVQITERVNADGILRMFVHKKFA